MGALDGQVALVTGGSRGIGRATAIALAEEGANVVINYTSNEDAAKATAAACEQHGVQTLVVQADVANVEDAQRLVKAAEEQFEKIDILVNNAGINRDKTVARMAPEDWDAVVQTDLSSAFYVTNAAVGGMRTRKYGRIIQISSIQGQQGAVGLSNYAAAKGGMIAFTKSAARELARDNITVNAICPGYVETDMISGLSDEVKQTLLSRIPLGRFGRPEEVAQTVVFLAKPSGDFYTGAQLNLNGGEYM
ncbi:MAG: 3-oxoacyl-ACP reductase FabG [Dehalococcoidia bacterium]|nr:3-oxoacyl-ACP reductase FabG [Dehalococcoidia bacterium]